IGMITALATRKLVMTQLASSMDADSDPAIWGSDTLATEESSTTMKVAIEITPTMVQGFLPPATERAGVHPELAAAASATQRTRTVGSTDIPGPNGQSRGTVSRSIFTGTRWTTLTKLPVAFSGGRMPKA